MNLAEEIARIAKQYELDGYVVFTHPDEDHLSGFGDLGVDILARKGQENVVVQVKQTRDDVSRDPEVSRLAGKVNAIPGWRYDLIVVSPEPEEKDMPGDTVEMPLERIMYGADYADRSAKAGDVLPALLVAWSSLEAAMRLSARAANIAIDGPSPAYLMRALYSNGLLARDEFDHVKNAYSARNAMAHGMQAPELDSRVPMYISSLTRKLLREFESVKGS